MFGELMGGQRGKKGKKKEENAQLLTYWHHSFIAKEKGLLLIFFEKGKAFYIRRRRRTTSQSWERAKKRGAKELSARVFSEAHFSQCSGKPDLRGAHKGTRNKQSIQSKLCLLEAGGGGGCASLHRGASPGRRLTRHNGEVLHIKTSSKRKDPHKKGCKD